MVGGGWWVDARHRRPECGSWVIYTKEKCGNEEHAKVGSLLHRIRYEVLVVKYQGHIRSFKTPIIVLPHSLVPFPLSQLHLYDS